MPDLPLIALIVFVAIFVQSLVGFGLALVSMPLLVAVVGLRVAAPLVALFGLLAEVLMLYHYRAALNLRAVWRIALTSVIGVPVGVWGLRQVDEAIILPLLGVVVTGYALYALFGPRLPDLKRPIWADMLGFLAGMLGGAYNMPGPPVIIYGTSRRWSPAEFKSNLQGFFILNSVLVVLTHVCVGNFTPDVLRGFVVAIPAVVLGALSGFALDRRVTPDRFHRLVLVVLVVLGVSLIL